MQFTLFFKLFAFMLLALFATYMEAAISIGKGKNAITS
tara:strand:- start:354 stop:467 length:114 start_codon:yes stop_codon:yes gene_type:complete